MTFQTTRIDIIPEKDKFRVTISVSEILGINYALYLVCQFKNHENIHVQELNGQEIRAVILADTLEEALMHTGTLVTACT